MQHERRFAAQASAGFDTPGHGVTVPAIPSGRNLLLAELPARRPGKFTNGRENI